MNRNQYLEELRHRLSFRGASRRRAKDIVAEVRSHLDESGEDPVEAFGKPDEYAERALRGYRWPTVRFLTLMLCAVVGGSLVMRSVSALRRGQAIASVPNSELLLWVVFSLAVSVSVLPVVHRRLGNSRWHVPIFILGAVLTVTVSNYLGSSVLGEHTLVRAGSWVMFMAGIGLVAATGLVWLVWRHLSGVSRSG